MKLVLEITSEERHLLGNNAHKSFRAVGGVIGRHSDCDWAIPDQKRHLSGRHAIVSYEEDGFHITDVSTNGIYLNGSEVPIGNENSARLCDADRLSMGNIEFVARLYLDADDHPFKSRTKADAPGEGGMNLPGKEHIADVLDPIALFRQSNGFAAEQKAISTPTDKNSLSKEEQIVSAPDHRAAANVAFEPPGMLPENWLTAVDEPDGTIEANAINAVPEVAKADSAEKSPDNPSVSIHEKALIDAFFNGLGVSPDLLKKVDATQVMQEMGASLQANIKGMVALMQYRAQLKNEFRMDMTLVKSTGNNPLKFSADSRQVLRHLFKPEPGSFLNLSESFAECYNDMQLHQLAILAGAQASLRNMFSKLSPEQIEAKVTSTHTGVSLSSKPARCWHYYCRYHQELLSEDDTFNRLFNDAFVRAYDEHINAGKKTVKGEHQ